jgi:hypothetical protein
MTTIPPHRVASAHGFLVGFYARLGRGDLCECELVKLTTWIVLQRGVGRE